MDMRVNFSRLARFHVEREQSGHRSNSTTLGEVDPERIVALVRRRLWIVIASIATGGRLAVYAALFFLPNDHAASGAWDASRLTTLPDGVLHYAPNGNFDDTGAFLPAIAGFNVADIADPSHLKTLPDGVHVLVWVGQCDGVTQKFLATVGPFLGDLRVFGYYLMDDPDPRSRFGISSPCPPERLREESDWLHEHVPGTKTVIVLMNLSDARNSPVHEQL